jgi:hypothetical protein
MTLTDEDIIARLTAVEDATVERKTSSDNRDWIKAAVAFSNTLENCLASAGSGKSVLPLR